MSARPTLLLLPLVTAVCASAQDAPAAKAPADVVRAAIAEAERLQAEGKFLEAHRVINDARPVARDAPREVAEDMFVAWLLNTVRAAEVYARGDDAGFYSPRRLAEEGLPADHPRVLLAAGLIDDAIRSVRGLPVPSLRARFATDPRFALLQRSPDFRVIRWTEWREPRAAIWADARLASGDPGCDALFTKLGDQAPPPGGTELKVVEDWMNANGPQGRPAPVDVWVFLFRASFLNPVNQGGWPTRLGLLRRPEVVADVIAELDRRAGETPSAGFAAACLVNLTVAAGDYDRARTLLAALEADAAERFLYDLAAHNARQLALLRRTEQGGSPELAVFLLDLQARATGLPVPVAGPGPGAEREGR